MMRLCVIISAKSRSDYMFSCVQVAGKFVGKDMDNFNLYTRSPHLLVIKKIVLVYALLFTSKYTQAYTHIFVQFYRLDVSLYPKYTTPTITTTLYK
jgi:hypothetical protein